MPRKKKAIPAYQYHRASGRARVCINGRDFFLGRYGSDSSRRKYAELIARHSSGVPIDPIAATALANDDGPTVAEIVVVFLRFAERHYVKNGRPTSQVHLFKASTGPLVKLFGSTPASDFGPLALKAVRAAMIDLGWCRTSCNQHVGRIRQIFRHAVEDELIPGEVLNRLRSVAPLLHGRTEAAETKPVEPVSDAVIKATLPFLGAVVADIVRVQRLTGMRPGEACAMRWEEVDRSANVWLYRPAHHKLEHHGLPRVIAIGPKAQAILRLRRGLKTAVAGPVFPGRGGAFTVAAYRRAIARACDLAFPPTGELPAHQQTAWHRDHRWHPNQLRHSFATEVRKSAGLDVVAATLGHSKIATSQVYAQNNIAAAAAMLLKIG